MGAIDERVVLAKRYLDNNGELLRKELEEHNKVLHELNQKVVNIMKASKPTAFGHYDENGEIVLDTPMDYDPTTKELLLQVKKDNEEHLKSLFPNLYMLTELAQETDPDKNLFKDINWDDYL